MDGQTDSVQATLMSEYETHLARIDQIFGEAPKQRAARTFILWNEARKARYGVIVELGTYLGRNAIMMALAASIPVYTVDDYVEKRGEFGRPYGIQDKEAFLRNVNSIGVNVSLIEGDALKVAVTWDRPISLLYWDLAVADRIQDDLKAWSPCVVGKVFVHDTSDKVFGVSDGEYLGGELWQVR